MKPDKNKSKRARTVILIILGLLGLVFIFGPDLLSQNYRGPFKGRVVDADTKEPIERAVVFVSWGETHLFSGETFYDASEILTNKKGEFYIPKKWSWNPWTNLGLDSHFIIFKAGYSHVGTHYSDLEGKAEFLRSLTPEKRKEVGPNVYYNIEFENDFPIFLLKNLTTITERSKNLSRMILPARREHIPLLLEEEIHKEEESMKKDYEAGQTK